MFCFTVQLISLAHRDTYTYLANFIPSELIKFSPPCYDQVYFSLPPAPISVIHADKSSDRKLGLHLGKQLHRGNVFWSVMRQLGIKEERETYEWDMKKKLRRKSDFKQPLDAWLKQRSALDNTYTNTVIVKVHRKTQNTW